MDKVQHFEIPADDLARAQKFYSHVFGWRINKFPIADIEYYMISTVETDEKQMPKVPGAINGGMMKRTGKQGVTVAVTVSSIDETLKKIEKAGGKIIMDTMKVADMGLYAYVQDTEGNVIGIWQELKRM